VLTKHWPQLHLDDPDDFTTAEAIAAITASLTATSASPADGLRLVDYGRSRPGEDIESQHVALQTTGCAPIFSDPHIPRKALLPQLDTAHAVLRPGDTRMVCKLIRGSSAVQQLRVDRHRLLVHVLGEGPLLRVRLVGLDVRGGVPLVHDLDRMRAEPVFAGCRPLVGRIGNEVAEHPDRLGVRADR
jgi:hypothetical protein